MSKEDFLKQLEIARQQVLNEKSQEELQTRQAIQLAEATRLEQITNEQKLMAQKIEDTRKNFAGTNIIETLEYIRDNQILVLDSRNERIEKRDRDFLGFIIGNTHYENGPPINTAAEIVYEVDSVTLLFDKMPGDGEYQIPTSYKKISIKKSDNIITLEYKNNCRGNGDFNLSSHQSSEIIKEIARVVALKQVK